MSTYVAILGTTSTHGGTMITASGNSFTTKQGAVCLQGDLHSCPIYGHGITAIVSGCTIDAQSNGKFVAISGSMAACGAMLNANFASDTALT